MPPASSKKPATQEKGEEELKKRWSDGLGFPCPIPYGQWETKDNFTQTHLKHVKEYWQTLEARGEWPQDLLSFEAWCGMTNFDNSKPDGGPVFQRLMLMVLSGGKARLLTGWTGVESQMDFNTMWDANSRTYGPMFKTDNYTFGKHPPDQWYEGFMLSGDGLGIRMIKDQRTEEWVSTGAHLSKHSRPTVAFYGLNYGGRAGKPGEAQRMGLGLGNHNQSGNSMIKSDAEKNIYMPMHHYEIYTKHDWLVKGMLQTGTEGGGSYDNTLAQGLVSPGIDKVAGQQGNLDGQCWEVTRLGDDKPCILVQNSLAAIYGLYYYPNCNDPIFNWEVEEYVPDNNLNQSFRIRFRCPNPMYGQQGWAKNPRGQALDTDKKLYVYEPLNNKNKQFLEFFLEEKRKEYNMGRAQSEQLPKRPPNDYVGGLFTDKPTSQDVHKFYVPRATRFAPNYGADNPDTHPTISPWMYLVNQKKQMLVGSFWNKSTDWHDLRNGDESFRRGAILRNAGILAAGDEKDGVAFGFRISQAFLLYPFRTPHNNSYIKRDLNNTYEQAIAGGARRVAYMTEPKWRTDPTKVVDPPLAKSILDWDDWWADENRTEEIWRAKLLDNTDPTLGPRPPPISSNKRGKQRMPPTAQPGPSRQPTQPDPQIPFTAAPPDGGAGATGNSVEAVPQRIDPIDTGVDTEADVARPEEAGDLGQTEGNNLGPQAASVAESLSDTRQTVATSFGIPGMSIAETLKECDPEWEKEDFTDLEVRKAMTKTRPTGLRESKLFEALLACNLYDPTLDEGAAKRKGESHCHWPTARHSPWSHEECYERALIEYKLTRMDPTKIAAHKAKYGHDANLVQDSAHNIATIDDVELSWGSKKSVMEDLITYPGNIHRINLARILVIYFAPEGVGWFSHEDKQAGMLKGLYCCEGSQYNPQEVKPPKPEKRGRGRKKTSNLLEQIWKPVFTNDPEAVLPSKLLHCLTQEYLCHRATTNDTELINCLNNYNKVNSTSWKDELGVLTSNMQVKEWITTPWHLEHLPYQRQYAVFRDGETFSEGCKRCSRIFYEYAYHVYADRNAKNGTFGYPQDLWQSTSDQRVAPIPLHDPVFWSDTALWADAEPRHPNNAPEGGVQYGRPSKKKKKQLRVATDSELAELAEVDRDEQIAREYDFYTGGTMAWPTFELRKDRLQPADRERKNVKSTGALYFRRYLNLAYSVDLAEGKMEDKHQRYYESVTQGYMHGGRHKVRFGHKNYKVTRSHKYGNVCRDCAGTLDKAPGLFVRNNRWQFSGGLVTGNSEAVNAAPFDYWQHMFSGITDDNGNPASMDAFLYTGRRKVLSRLPADEKARYIGQFDTAASALATSLNARHKFPDHWTKLIEQPTIHIQQNLKSLDDMTPQNIQEAIRVLRKLFNGEDVSNERLDNPALKDICREAERKYMHNEAYARIDSTKQFDSDVKRTEYRNCVIRYSAQGLEWLNPPGTSPRLNYTGVESQPGVTLPQGEKKFGKLTESRYIKRQPPATPVVFYNCLITDQYDPDQLDQRIKDFKMPTPQSAYRQEVYLATRTGARGAGSHPTDIPTQWKGDGFVCEPQDETRPWKPRDAQNDGRALVQYRTLRQSRLFITYSLHRPISDENEGRVILERMADALYTLFGTDRWLSEMIVFGKMLKSMDVAGQRSDNLGKAMWGIIDKTKKQEAMEGFYGSRDPTQPRTSYVYDTYETHMDKLDVDGGCEIGPKMGHPHFHLLLTMNHFSYVQFDYFKMNTFLEIMFRGVDTFHGWAQNYMLPNMFYGDNENPYVDIRLYPQDNWKEILAAYVRKNAIPSIVEVESARRVPGTATQRRRATNFNVVVNNPS